MTVYFFFAGVTLTESCGNVGIGLLVAFSTLLIIGSGQVIKVDLQFEESTRRILKVSNYLNYNSQMFFQIKGNKQLN